MRPGVSEGHVQRQAFHQVQPLPIKGLVGDFLFKRSRTNEYRPCPSVPGKHGFTVRPTRLGSVVTESYPMHVPVKYSIRNIVPTVGSDNFTIGMEFGTGCATLSRYRQCTYLGWFGTEGLAYRAYIILYLLFRLGMSQDCQAINRANYVVLRSTICNFACDDKTVEQSVKMIYSRYIRFELSSAQNVLKPLKALKYGTLLRRL
jgi:hypothetical protein